MDELDFGAPDTVTFGGPGRPDKPSPLAGPTRPAPPASMTRRFSRLVVVVLIAVLALAVAITGTVYLLRTWPVVRPTGLASDKQGTGSVNLEWSGPSGGPLPDKYVILRNGAVAGTVPGTVGQFTDKGLAPATTYDFRVIAYRGGARSKSSHDLRVATKTPPLSAAEFNSSYLVNETVDSGGSGIKGDADGDSWQDEWTFSSDCAAGSCPVTLYGAINGEDFTASLEPQAGGTYTGQVAINDYYYCGSDTANYSASTLEISVNPTTGHAVGMQWQVAHFNGNMTWVVLPNAIGNCGDATLAMGVEG